MLTSNTACLGENLTCNVSEACILIVGAGGIGCELLKNVVLTGFKDIHVIDLDTIDVSNLNRQFLFQRKHVGKSKSQVAKESVLAFGKDIKVTSYHDSVLNPEYNIDFFQQFTIVMNALDNKAARNHVNRMCLAAEVPLVESGTAGYLGQVTVIKKGLTECYECQPKPTQKSYPGCTIRNTPSEPIHCIVWAKHLFNQLFGEADADEEVSPDTEDPELSGDAGNKALSNSSKGEKNIERVSTRAWASNVEYNGQKLFNKFFNSDIKYLLSMDKLWKARKAPLPLTWDSCIEGIVHEEKNGHNVFDLRDKETWTIKKCAMVFNKTTSQLHQELKVSGEALIWDKDDDVAMDFVTAAANLRCYLFHIPVKTRFDIKSMAGNIIPAIATTNAIIAGLLVVEALKILSGMIDKCKTVYLNRTPNARKKLLLPCNLEKPNPNCYVCASKPEVTVYLNVDATTVKGFEEKVLKERLGMVAPDVEIDDGKGTILISSEEGETDQNASKFLSDFKIASGSRLKGDDFLQNYELIINIRHSPTADVNSDLKVEIKVPREAKEEEESLDKEEPVMESQGPSAQAVESVPLSDDEARRKRKLSEIEERSPKKTKVDGTEDEIIVH